MVWAFSLFLGIGIMSLEASCANTIYINAKIYDGVAVDHNHDAFVVSDGRFKTIGTTSQLVTANPGAIIYDLKGARVMPGFIEAHGHLLGVGKAKLMLNLKGLSLNQISSAITAQSAKQPSGTWIVGRGWDQNLWPGGEFPSSAILDDVVKDHPVRLSRVDGHAIWVNSLALKIAKVDEHTPCPPGGQIQKDNQGKPTGVLIDHAMELVDHHIKSPQTSELRSQLDTALKEAASLGITSFHDAGVDKDTINLYREYAQKKQLTLRIYAMVNGENQNLVNEFLGTGPEIGDFLTIRTIKYFADGALGSRGALLFDDYHDEPGNRGLSLITEEDLVKKTVAALQSGFSVATHAIGDRANHVVLNAYEQALKDTGARDARLRVEHAQLIDPADHARFKKLGVIASMQPIHCTSDSPWVASRLGEARLKGRAYPWRSLLASGARLAFGSDGPVEAINPLWGIMAATTREQPGHPPFMPEEALTLGQALQGYFEGAAYAEFNEQSKGRIKEGYLADFVVFDEDILKPTRTLLWGATPKMTVVNGAIVHHKQ